MSPENKKSDIKTPYVQSDFLSKIDNAGNISQVEGLTILEKRIKDIMLRAQLTRKEALVRIQREDVEEDLRDRAGNY